MITTLVTINQVAEASCVYCRKGHLFNNYLENPGSINYIGNFNRPNQNNPYSNTYNLELRQHPNFSWNNQNQHAAATSGQNMSAQPPRFHQQNQG